MCIVQFISLEVASTLLHKPAFAQIYSSVIIFFFRWYILLHNLLWLIKMNICKAKLFRQEKNEDVGQSCWLLYNQKSRAHLLPAYVTTNDLFVQG